MATVKKPKIEIYVDAEGRWRWRWVAANGLILAESSQSYSDKRDCVRGLEIVTGGWLAVTWRAVGIGYAQGTLTRWTGSAVDADQHAHTARREVVFLQVLPAEGQ